MDLGIKGRVAVVAASSKGLGKAISTALAREGASVALCARNEGELDRTGRQIEAETGSRVLYRRADITDEAQTDEFIKNVLEAYGKIDILVTNAGGPPPGKFMDMSESDWRGSFELTLNSAIRLCRLALPSMKERRWGRIVFMTSLSAKQPVENLILSNVIRPGLHGLMKSLSNDLAEYGILVNAVCPGYILTDRVRSLFESQAEAQQLSTTEVRARMERTIPLNRLGAPEEVGDLVAYLASERASYITGCAVVVDGGMIKASF